MIQLILQSNFSQIGKRYSRNRNWSAMQDDIIRLIVGKLGYYAYHRKFAAACVDWYRITKEIHGPFQENSLFLLLPFNYETKTCSLYQISNSKTLEFSLPELQDKFVHGSSNGFLAVADDNFQLSLINPLTREQIPLPEPTYAVDSLEQVGNDMHDPFFRSYLLSKFVVSENASLSTGTLVATIMSDISKLFICRLGDDSWTRIQWFGSDSMSMNREDMTFYGGKLYAIGSSGPIVVVEFDGFDFKPYCIGWPKMSPLGVMLHRARGYLVKCSEDLLLVNKIAEYHTKTKPYKTVDFEVYRFEDNTKSWSRIHDLSEHSLFIGRNESIALSSEDLPNGYKSNCIYFADDYNEGQGGEPPFGYQFDNGVFSLSDGSMEMLNISHSVTHWVCTPLWYQQKMSISITE